MAEEKVTNQQKWRITLQYTVSKPPARCLSWRNTNWLSVAKLLEWMTLIGWKKKYYQQKKPKFDSFALYFYFHSKLTDPFL